MQEKEILKLLVDNLALAIKPGMLSGTRITLTDNLLLSFYRAKLYLENPESTVSIRMDTPLIMQTCKKCFVYNASPQDYPDVVCPACGEAY
jgi:hypothetical protein